MRAGEGRALAASLALLLAAAGCTTPAAAPAPSQAASAPTANAPDAAAPASAAAGGAPPARVALNMPYSGRGVAGLAHYLAVEDGLYAAQGLDVTSPNIGNPPTVI